MALSALAASVLLNVYLGFAKRPDERMVASAVVEPASTRGPTNKELRQVRVPGPARGYVTLLVLSNERKQLVMPGGGVTFIRIPPDGVSDRIVLDEDAVRVVFVVSETPTGEVIRRAFENDSRRYSANQEAELVQNVTRLLRDSGYRQFVVGTESVPSP